MIYLRDGNYNVGESLYITAVTLNNYMSDRPGATIPYPPGLQTHGERDGVPTLVDIAVAALSSAEQLRTQIRAMLEPPKVYAALETTLDKICGTTVPSIIVLLTRGVLKTQSPLERRIWRKVYCMHTVLKNFATAKEMTFHQLFQQLCGLHNCSAILLTAWNLIWWTFCKKQLIKKLNRCLEDLRSDINALLFEASAPNFYLDISSHSVDFYDFFGHSWSLPEDLCLDREIFHAVLQLKYRNSPAEPIVLSQKFRIFVQGEMRMVIPDEWERTIISRCRLQLCVVVNQPQLQSTSLHCPRCAARAVYLDSPVEWIDCYRCGSTFNIRATDVSEEASDVNSSEGIQPPGITLDQHAAFKFYVVQMITESLDDHGTDQSRNHSAAAQSGTSKPADEKMVSHATNGDEDSPSRSNISDTPNSCDNPTAIQPAPPLNQNESAPIQSAPVDADGGRRNDSVYGESSIADSNIYHNPASRQGPEELQIFSIASGVVISGDYTGAGRNVYNLDPSITYSITTDSPPPLTSPSFPSNHITNTVILDPEELQMLSHAPGVVISGDYTGAGRNVYNPDPSITYSITTDSPPPLTSPSFPSIINTSNLRRLSYKKPEHDSEVYARLLLPKKHGWPLWLPRPRNTLPYSYRKQGVSIGDVGIITANGEFDFLFNICRPADDAINRNRVPENFKPIDPPGDDNIRSDPDGWRPGDYLRAGSIRAQVLQTAGTSQSFQFECSASEGAITVLPRGGSRQDLLATAGFFDYAGENAEHWYKFVNTPRRSGGLGRGASNGALHLITGVDKTSSWGTGCFSEVVGEGTFPIQFREANSDENEAKYTYLWSQSGLAATRHGPIIEQFDTPEPPENQCTFLRGFSVAISETIWASMFKRIKIQSLQFSPSLLSKSKSRYVPFGGKQNSGISGYFDFSRWAGSGSNKKAGENGAIVAPDFSMPSQSLHPSNAINAYLLSQDKTAKVAITHDSVWFSVVEDGATHLPSPSEMLGRLSTTHERVTVNGVAYFSPKKFKRQYALYPLDSASLQAATEGANEETTIPTIVVLGRTGSQNCSPVPSVTHQSKSPSKGSKTFCILSKVDVQPPPNHNLSVSRDNLASSNQQDLASRRRKALNDALSDFQRSSLNLSAYHRYNPGSSCSLDVRPFGAGSLNAWSVFDFPNSSMESFASGFPLFNPASIKARSRKRRSLASLSLESVVSTNESPSKGHDSDTDRPQHLEHGLLLGTSKFV